MLKLDPQRLKELLQEIEQARRAHAAWQDNLIGTLVCHEPKRSVVPATGCDRDCSVCQWSSASALPELSQQPVFRAIESDHRRIHCLGERLLWAVNQGMPVARRDYDELTACRQRLRLELDSLYHEVQAALAHRDALTGVYQREVLEPELREWHELVRRGAQDCCVAFMDLDHFKDFNDHHGHLVGDRVLSGALRCVTENLRPYDKAFRYGGDEFLFLLPAVDLAAGRLVVERLRRELAATPLVLDAAGSVLFATGSFGIARLDPEEPPQVSVDRADTALLTAKSLGRNRVVAWDPGVVTHRGLRRLELSRVAGESDIG